MEEDPVARQLATIDAKIRGATATTASPVKSSTFLTSVEPLADRLEAVEQLALFIHQHAVSPTSTSSSTSSSQAEVSSTTTWWVNVAFLRMAESFQRTSNSQIRHALVSAFQRSQPHAHLISNRREVCDCILAVFNSRSSHSAERASAFRVLGYLSSAVVGGGSSSGGGCVEDVLYAIDMAIGGQNGQVRAGGVFALCMMVKSSDVVALLVADTVVELLRRCVGEDEGDAAAEVWGFVLAVVPCYHSMPVVSRRLFDVFVGEVVGSRSVEQALVPFTRLACLDFLLTVEMVDKVLELLGVATLSDSAASADDSVAAESFYSTLVRCLYYMALRRPEFFGVSHIESCLRLISTPRYPSAIYILQAVNCCCSSAAFSSSVSRDVWRAVYVVGVTAVADSSIPLFQLHGLRTLTSIADREAVMSADGDMTEYCSALAVALSRDLHAVGSAGVDNISRRNCILNGVARISRDFDCQPVLLKILLAQLAKGNTGHVVKMIEILLYTASNHAADTLKLLAEACAHAKVNALGMLRLRIICSSRSPPAKGSAEDSQQLIKAGFSLAFESDPFGLYLLATLAARYGLFQVATGWFQRFLELDNYFSYNWFSSLVRLMNVEMNLLEFTNTFKPDERNELTILQLADAQYDEVISDLKMQALVTRYSVELQIAFVEMRKKMVQYMTCACSLKNHLMANAPFKAIISQKRTELNALYAQVCELGEDLMQEETQSTTRYVQRVLKQASQIQYQAVEADKPLHLFGETKGIPRFFFTVSRK